MLVHERAGRSHSRAVPLLLLATYALIRLDPDMIPRVEVRVSGFLLLVLLLIVSLWKITVLDLLVTMTTLVLLTFLRLVLLQLLL